MVEYQENLGMPPNEYRDDSESSPDFEFTKKYIEEYEEWKLTNFQLTF